jgi:integrase/recombinase XerC
VNLHLSVLSGFCRFLLREGHLQANPVRTVRRPKAEKRLPVFYRDASMEHYFARTAHSASEDELAVLESFGPFVGNRSESARTPVQMYERRLRRLIISLLHASGIRRSELIGLNLDSLDAGRQTLRVRGKGDKMREIPLISSVWQEILLYLHSVE